MYQVRELKYDNGLRLLVAETPEHPDAYLSIQLPYGDAHCAGEKRETSHFVEHMLMASTPSRGYTDLSRELDRMTIEADETDRMTRTSLGAIIPPEYISPAIGIIFDCFQNKAFDLDEVEAERKAIERELDARQSDTEVYAYDKLTQAVFKGHPFGYGNHASIRAITTEDLVKAKGEHYHPDNLVVSFVGSVSPEIVCDMIGQTFGSMARAGIKKTRFERQKNNASYIREERDTDSSVLYLGWAVNGSESVQEMFAFHILQHVMGGSRNLYTRSSRLYNALRAGKGFAYSPNADYSVFNGVGFFRIEVDGGVKRDDLDNVKKLIHQEIEKIRADKISDQEFDLVRQSLKKGEQRQNFTNGKDIAGSLGFNALEGLSPDFGSFEQQVDSLTPSSVRDVARKYLTDEHVTVEIVGTGNGF